jgi:MFS family permease
LASESASQRVGYISVLGNRGFLFLWSATLISRTGDYLLSVAMIWFVYGILTHNPLYAGLITAFYYIPNFIFAPYFGKIVDTHSRKKVMITATLLQFAFAVMLYASVVLKFMVLDFSFISVFAIATFGMLVSISRSSSIPLAVPKEALTAANSLQQATTQLTRVLGYAAGGVLLLLISIKGIIAIEIVIFLISSLILSMMKIRNNPESSRRKSGLDGFRYIRNERLFFEIVVFLSIVNFTGAGMTVLPAIMSRTVFRSGSSLFVSILVALAIGTIAGNYIVTRFRVGLIAGKILIAANLIDALLYVLFAYSPTPLFATAAAAGIGFVEGISIVPFVTLIQAKTPNDRLGGVLAALSMILLGSASLSMISSGFLVSLVGVRTVYILFALVMVIMSVVAINMKELRNASY